MYLVEWSDLAFNRLMHLMTSLAPDDWERVVVAVNLLDDLLAEDPLE